MNIKLLSLIIDYPTNGTDKATIRFTLLKGGWTKNVNKTLPLEAALAIATSMCKRDFTSIREINME